MLKCKGEVYQMNNKTLSADDVTEEQAKAEIARMQMQIDLLFEQIKRDNQESQKIKARTEATMMRVNETLTRLEAKI